MNTNSLITGNNWLKFATDKLITNGIKSARLDAILILEQITNLTRIEIVSSKNLNLNNKQIDKLNFLVERRSKDEPMAYIRGHTEFYGREFSIDTGVLIPRPESEAFIEIVKSIDSRKSRVADIGTGSGILGITLCLELPDLEVDLYDTSKEALELANINANKFNLNLEIIESDLLKNLKYEYGVIMANLPYVPDKMKKSKNLSFEPRIALFSGEDGMDLYKKFWNQINSLSIKPDYVLTESLINQHPAMNGYASLSNYRLIKSKGLVQLFERI